MTLEKAGVADAPPSLVIVVDEFAALVDGGAGVRRRRRQRRPARPLARPAPDPGDPAAGRRHQGQPARQHQPAARAADGRRGRQHRRARARRRRRSSTRRSRAGRCPRPGRAGWCRSRPATPAAGPATRRRRPRSSSRSWASAPARSGRRRSRSSVAPVDPGPTDIRRLVATVRRGQRHGRDRRRRASRGCPSCGRSTTWPTRTRCRLARDRHRAGLRGARRPGQQSQPTVAF